MVLFQALVKLIARFDEKKLKMRSQHKKKYQKIYYYLEIRQTFLICSSLSIESHHDAMSVSEKSKN